MGDRGINHHHHHHNIIIINIIIIIINIITIIINIIIIIIININGWAIWPVPSPELQLLSPAFLWSPNCSLSLWTVVVWF
jgi:hypothetical protein